MYKTFIHPRVKDMQSQRLGKPRRGLQIFGTRVDFPVPVQRNGRFYYSCTGWNLHRCTPISLYHLKDRATVAIILWQNFSQCTSVRTAVPDEVGQCEFFWFKHGFWIFSVQFLWHYSGMSYVIKTGEFNTFICKSKYWCTRYRMTWNYLQHAMKEI